MKNQPPGFAAVLSAAFIVVCPLVSAQSLSLSGTVSNTVGETAVIGLSSSGDKTNTNTWSVGEVGRFLIQDAEGSVFGLKVEAYDPTGMLSAGTDSLMVARTVSSQGLTDTGTLSVYVNPGSGSSASTGAWTLSLRFSFFDSTFTNPEMVDLLLTSLDIDYDQRYYVKNEDFSSNMLYAGSTLVAASTVAGYTGFTSPTNSTYNNPKNAVSSKGNVLSEFEVMLAHDQQALYMFEFRNPSQIVPEPGAALLGGFGALWMLRRRKR